MHAENVNKPPIPDFLTRCRTGDHNISMPLGHLCGGQGQRRDQDRQSAIAEMQQLVDDEGDKISGLTVAWSVPGEDQAWRSKKGRDWGFKRANLTLQTGYIQLGGNPQLA